jgi:hypothetical protein
MAVSKVYQDYVDNMRQGLFTCSIFIDISKAFDSVNHSLLLRKLSYYGVRGLTLDLLKDFLSNRYHCTLINDATSPLLPVTCGVPQGSVLGPFLFLVFINDLPKCTILKSTLFADDAALSFAHTSFDIVQDTVNSELKKVSNWIKGNKLQLNIDKTNYLIIHNKRTVVVSDIKINGKSINRVNEVKYLGVVFDNKLTWKPHIESVAKKISKCMWATTRLRPYTNLETLKLVYYALAYPHMVYCVSTWGGAYDDALKCLEVIKNK